MNSTLGCLLSLLQITLGFNRMSLHLLQENRVDASRCHYVKNLRSKHKCDLILRFRTIPIVL